MQDGPHDKNCVDPSDERMQSAILAASHYYFNTFGPQKPKNPDNSNDVQHWVVISWGSTGACPNLDSDLYQSAACNGNAV